MKNPKNRRTRINGKRAKKGSKQRKPPLFNADELATELHSAVTRDLAADTQVYTSAVGRDSQRELTLDKRLSLELLKKYERLDTDSELLQAEAFQAFHKTNNYVGRVDKASNFPYQGLREPMRRQSYRIRVHKKARALCHQILGDYTEDEWFESCKFSAGATWGVPFTDTSMEAKMELPLSTTSRARLYFDRYLEWDHQFREALNLKSSNEPLYREIGYTRATTVNKDSRKRRLIVPESTVGMFLQLGMMVMMYKRLKRFRLNVTTLPEKHRDLARIASITGRKATIDWSDASNSVGIELLRWLIPPKWFEVMDRITSRYVDVGGRIVQLNMFSTMGNALTFPLETLVFWTYAVAVESVETGCFSNHPKWWRTKCSVFGDDCIVPSAIAQSYIQVMEGIGFKVNQDKTHADPKDRFRESCGGDYLAGYETRPFHLKAPSGRGRGALEAWLYIMLNRLLEKYILCFGSLKYVYDKRAFKFIFDAFYRYKICPKLVPRDYPEDSGIRDLDGARLYRVYGVAGSQILADQHGTKAFQYLRYRYWNEREQRPMVRYWDCLKWGPPEILWWDSYEGDIVFAARTSRSSTSILAKKRATDMTRAETSRMIDVLGGLTSTPIRRRGGYIVANGISGHWSVST